MRMLKEFVSPKSRSTFRLLRGSLNRKDEVLGITSGVFSGAEYVDQYYPEWLHQELKWPERRNNFVLVDQHDRVVALASYFFTDQNRRVFQHAVRVKSGLQRQGVGQIFLGLMQEELFTTNPNLQELVGSVGVDIFPFGMIQDGKMGKILGQRGQLFYSSLPNAKRVNQLLAPSSPLQPLSLTKMTGLLVSPQGNRLLHNRYLVSMWYGYYACPSMEDSIKMAHFNPMHILVNNQESPTSMSILTLPFKVQAGHMVGIDIFTHDETEFKRHLKAQISLARALFEVKRLDANSCFFVVLPNAAMNEFAKEVLERDLKLASPPYQLQCDNKHAQASTFFLYSKGRDFL